MVRIAPYIKCMTLNMPESLTIIVFVAASNLGVLVIICTGGMVND